MFYCIYHDFEYVNCSWKIRILAISDYREPFLRAFQFFAKAEQHKQILFIFLNKKIHGVRWTMCKSPFLPKASFGLRVLSLPACVRVSVNHELVCAITRHKFELESPNLDQKMQNILLKVPIVLGTDWACPSRSNFTLLKDYVYLHRFCIFEIFVRHVCLTAPHPTWLRTHSLTTTCPPTGSCDRLWNCLYVYLGETIGVSASLDLAIGTQFYKFLSVFDILYTPHMPKFYMPTLGNRRNNSKTAPISLYFVRLSMLGKLSFASNSAIFSAVNNYVTTLRGLTRDI